MVTLKAKRIMYLSVAVIVLMLSCVFVGCNKVTVTEGYVVNKTIGEPLLFEFGQFRMIDPREKATEYCIWVEAENGDTACFYVSKQEFLLISVGDWFVYDRSKHLMV